MDNSKVDDQREIASLSQSIAKSTFSLGLDKSKTERKRARDKKLHSDERAASKDEALCYITPVFCYPVYAIPLNR